MATVKAHHPDWLQQWPGESDESWQNRVDRSCSFCAHPAFPDAAKATEHKTACETRTPQQRHALLADEIRRQR